MDPITNTKLVGTFLDFGDAMLGAGAEISRVEDSLSRLGKAYGAVSTDVFVITSSIVLTLTFQNGQVITQTRRIRNVADFDFEKIGRFNALARACAKRTVSCEELKEKIRKVSEQRVSRRKLYLGSALASGAFSLFFGGTLWDASIAALFGLLVCFLQRGFSDKCPNKAFFLFLSSFLCGTGICLIGKMIPPLRTDLVIMGVIMLLVPGIAITTAARDMVIGDTISGATKLLESILWAVTLAGGFMLSILLFGR